jgi:hypothetical protein
MKDKRRGSLLLEGVFALTVGGMACVVNLELVRRSFYEVLLYHAAFLSVRSEALSSPGRDAVRSFWQSALGLEAARRFSRRVQLGVERSSEGLVARAHVAYSNWIHFPIPRGIKRHFKITRKCPFILSP